MRAVYFLAKIAAMMVVIASLGGLRVWAASAARDSTYRLDVYALQLNKETQIVNSLDGGFVDGTVVTETAGVMPKKHLGGPTIEPIRARVRVDQFTQFLTDSLEGKADAATGTIYYIDNTGKVQQQRALNGLMLSELAFPGFTGSAKAGNALLLTLTLAAQSATTADPLAGALPPAQVDNTAAARAKRWAGDWHLQVPGLPTNRVSSIEPFTIRRKLPTAQDGGRERTKSPTQWEIPNLVFYMPPQDSQAWIAWHDDFVVQGNNADAQEKTLTLQFLTPDMKNVLLQLECTGVGIVSAKYEQPVTASTSAPFGFRVELYVETMKLTTGGATVATVAPATPASQPARSPLLPKTISKPTDNRVPAQ
jgi:hypothetical protein